MNAPKLIGTFCGLLTVTACMAEGPDALDDSAPGVELELELGLDEATDEPAEPSTPVDDHTSSAPSGEVEEASARAQAFLASVRDGGVAPGWDDARIVGSPVPLHRPDLEGPAYYEFTVEPAGFLVVATGEHDYPIAHWSPDGRPPSEELREKAEEVGMPAAMLYKLDTLSYAAETADGQLAAQLGGLPQRIDAEGIDDAYGGELMERTWMPEVDAERRVTGGRLTTVEYDPTSAPEGAPLSAMDRQVIGSESLVDGEMRADVPFAPTVESQPFESWDALKADYMGTYAPYLLKLREDASATWAATDVLVDAVHVQPDGDLELTDATDPVAAGWSTWYADGNAQGIFYEQLSPWEFPNGVSCHSGCGATAWMMLFAWADREAAFGSKWQNHWGIYRMNGGAGPNVVAPTNDDFGTRMVTWDLRARLKTFCLGSNGATYPGDMIGAWGYLAGRDYSPLHTTFNHFGFTTGAIASAAKHVIKVQDMPVIVGVGWLEHYPLAYGYASNPTAGEWFIVNQGWAGYRSDWIPAAAWFHGQILYVP